MVACLTSAGSLFLLGVFALNPEHAEEFTVGLRPSQFYRVFDNEERAFPDATYANVFGVAHNSGGRIETTLEALIYGADVIEVDVVEIDGVLFSAHTPPILFVGPRWFRGPSLEQVWNASYRADAIKLDLKESSPSYVALVAQFLVSRPPGREVMVASRSPHVLRTLRAQAPETILLLSVPSAEAFVDLQANTSLQTTIDGVTVRESVLDVESAYWLSNQELLMFAWTVNDVERVNELIQLGVDGITTENLAIMTLLGGQERREQDVVESSP
jgi:glycerophosphoryl diester phosphodiesterase